MLFYPHKVEFQRSDNGISLRTGITVSTDGVEIRRVNILNDSDRPRRLKLTSYGEVVLAEQAADRRHPAFNKLFIESEYLPKENALLFQRRPRSADEKPVVLIHAMVIEAGRKVTGDHESDRAQFLGRSQTTAHPAGAARSPTSHLSGTTGGTLDPIFSLAQEIDLKPHAKTRVTFLTLAAPSRAEALEKLSHYQTGQAIYHAFDEAHAHSERGTARTGNECQRRRKHPAPFICPALPGRDIARRAAYPGAKRKGQSGLWAFGISGDYPILLVRIRDGESPLLPEALQAFTYWRSRHVNGQPGHPERSGYRLCPRSAQYHPAPDPRMGAEAALNQRDGIFVLRTDQLQPADKILFRNSGRCHSG